MGEHTRILFSKPARRGTLELIPNMKFFGFTGLSTETKPTYVQDGNSRIEICGGSYFLEEDTGDISYFNEATGTWGGGD